MCLMVAILIKICYCNKFTSTHGHGRQVYQRTLASHFNSGTPVLAIVSIMLYNWGFGSCGAFGRCMYGTICYHGHI